MRINFFDDSYYDGLSDEMYLKKMNESADKLAGVFIQGLGVGVFELIDAGFRDSPLWGQSLVGEPWVLPQQCF